MDSNTIDRDKISDMPFFHTHHAPVGAWASLTFGAADKGVSIDLEEPEVKDSGTMLFGITNDEETHTIGFTERQRADTAVSGDRERPAVNGVFGEYGLYEEREICRTLTPSIDRYEAGKLCVTVYTPCRGLPDPRCGAIPSEMCLPGVLMDLTVDNTDEETPCTVFFGLAYPALKKLAVFEEKGIFGYGYKGSWAFSAQKTEESFLVQGGDSLYHLKKGSTFVHQNGPCFIGARVPAGEKRTLSVVWAVYSAEGSSGQIRTRYYYNRYFQNVSEAADKILKCADNIRQMSVETDRRLLDRVKDSEEIYYQLFCQAVRGYYASTQLLEDEQGGVHWNVSEGAYLWRNTMDLCADHLVWELMVNPWIVRSLMEDFLHHYSYYDRVYFQEKEGDYPGGISFCHDMGCFLHYTEAGRSAYERVNSDRNGFYFYMTTEELLNGIYCICGYVLKTQDVEWLKEQNNLLTELMDSLENRDAPEETERNGILKGISCRSGSCGLESTTFDSLDHSLQEASGNIYIFIKTWCALLLLKKCALITGDNNTAERAENMLQRCRRSAVLYENSGIPWLKANAYRSISGAVAAAAEPLAVPCLVGAFVQEEEQGLSELLYRHETACLKSGVCLDDITGGLRLSSTSANTWPSKVTLTLFVLKRILGITVPESTERELLAWAQVSAADCTISDQIRSDTGTAIGGHYYPRIVTAASWLW